MTIKTQNFPFSLALISIVSFAALNFPYTKPTVPILGFHGVLDSKKQSSLPTVDIDEMNYSKVELEKLLEYLLKNNYWFLTSQDLYDYFITKSQGIPAEYRGKKPIMLTFDDGYKSVHTKLFPILSRLQKKYGIKIKVVLFINPGRLVSEAKQSKTHLSCQELREGLQKGFYDIQSHGLNHRDLTKLNRRQLVSELLRARSILRKCTRDLDPQQNVASHFAYPYGAYSKQAELYVSRYYLSGYLYNDGILDASCKNNYYQIPRLIVNYNKSAQEIINIAEGFTLPNGEKNSNTCK